MKKSLVYIGSTLLASLVCVAAMARPMKGVGKTSLLKQANAWAAPQQAAGEKKGPQWKSTDEYNAFQAAANEKDAHKKISLAEAFLAKFTDTDFKDLAYLQEMAAYQQLGEGANAIKSGEKALESSPDNLEALRFVCFALPFVYKPTDTDAAAQLTRTEGEAKHGLELLEKLQKPANATQEQFTQAVKGLRSVFNGSLGFAAMQKKDYAAAITSLKTAAEDDPSNNLTFSMLGQSYLQSTPPDYDNGIWSLARSVALSKASNSPNAAALAKYYDQVYTNRHGSNEGEQDIVTQAAASVNPPDGFKVGAAPKHAATGNAFVDAFYSYEDALKAGGDTEKEQWNALKGQQFEGPGFVDSVEAGTDPDTTVVHIDISDVSKGKEGTYDIALRDKQPEAKHLAKGAPVRFKGAMAEYTMTPNFFITLDGTINDDDLAAGQDKGKPKPKPKPRTPTRRKTTGR
jgi:tetratricopeptide (TPR) repeat protein